MARRRAGECGLCGRFADRLEEEDVYPSWARRELTSTIAEAKHLNQWPARVVLRACGDCNRGLGALFEDAAAPVLKPLMHGGRHVLDRHQRASIARWAWLKDIEHLLGRPYLMTSQGQVPHTQESLAHWRSRLAHLRGTRQLPPGYVVRLAIIGSPRDTIWHQPLVPPGWKRGPHGLASHNGLGRLVIESIETEPVIAAQFVERARHDPRCSIVWPLLEGDCTVGDRTVPLNRLQSWRAELGLNPRDGRGGGWRIPIEPGT